MHLASLLIGIAIGSLLTLAVTFLWRPRRRQSNVRAAAVRGPAPPPEPAPPLANPERPTSAPLTLDSSVDDGRLTDLLERSRRLNRDTVERVRRGSEGPITEPAPTGEPPPVSAEPERPDARLAHLHELNRRLEADARRRLSR